jgi:hypothetical protein
MTGQGSGPKPYFRCKVLKPPRYLVDSKDRIPVYPPIDVVAGVIRRAGRFLITQRLPDDTLGGYWEFPGGKVEQGEDLPAALRRRLGRRSMISFTPIPSATCGSTFTRRGYFSANRASWRWPTWRGSRRKNSRIINFPRRICRC